MKRIATQSVAAPLTWHSYGASLRGTREAKLAPTRHILRVEPDDGSPSIGESCGDDRPLASAHPARNRCPA